MPLTSNGGKPDVKPMPYSPPKGPTNQSRESPGLGGDNYGNCGSQGSYHGPSRESGSPGISSGSNRGSQR